MGMTLFEYVGLPHNIEHLTCMEELKLLLLNKKCSMIYLFKHFAHTIESIKTLIRYNQKCKTTDHTINYNSTVNIDILWVVVEHARQNQYFFWNYSSLTKCT